MPPLQSTPLSPQLPAGTAAQPSNRLPGESKVGHFPLAAFWMAIPNSNPGPIPLINLYAVILQKSNKRTEKTEPYC